MVYRRKTVYLWWEGLWHQTNLVQNVSFGTYWLTLGRSLNFPEPCFFIYKMEVLILTFHSYLRTTKHANFWHMLGTQQTVASIV